MSNKTKQVLVLDANGAVIDTIDKDYFIDYEIVSNNKIRVFVKRLCNSGQWIEATVNFEIKPHNNHVYDAVIEWS